MIVVLCLATACTQVHFPVFPVVALVCHYHQQPTLVSTCILFLEISSSLLLLHDLRD